MGGSNEDGGIENDSHGIAVVVSGESCRGKFIAKGARSKRLTTPSSALQRMVSTRKGGGTFDGE